MEYKFHPAADLFPLLQEELLLELANDIKANGQLDPIVVDGNVILDGRNRFLACKNLGITPTFKEWEGTEQEIIPFIVSKNIHRRHLTQSDKAIIAVQLIDLFKEDSKKRQLKGLKNQSSSLETSVSHEGKKSSELAGNILGVSYKSVERAKNILKNGSNELIEKVRNNEINLSDANDISKFGKSKQIELINKSQITSFKEIRNQINDEQILASASWIQSKKSSENALKYKNDRIEANKLIKPTGKYSTIIIDFPWDIAGSTRMGELEYPTMSLSEIKNEKENILNIAETNSWLLLWSPISFLPNALEVMKHFDYIYKFNLVWVKRRSQGGLCGIKPNGYPRYTHEHLIFGSKGNPKFDDVLDFDTVINGERREHSRKPEEIYKLLERVCPKNIIDLYSRENWKLKGLNIHSWGLEKDKLK